jgi:predicted YcjX-like family ATPase
MPRIPKTTRIAVTGIAGGGKTVFLTTLLSHLAEYNVENADGFGSIPEIFRFHELRGKRWPEFRLHEHRQSLARGTWPEKSVDCSQFVVQYDRSDWRFRSQRLELFDFPGERIADAAVAALGSYDDWSDHILDHFVHNQDYSDVAQSYLTYISSGKLTEHELLHTYRFILASLILQYKPLISPSTFLLDQRGGKARPGTPDEIASERFCGTSSESQFAPLSKEARESNPELTKYMRRVFADYRKTVALPIFNELGRAQRLVILVDIPTLLAGGVGRFNDERQILIDLFDVLRPNSQLGELLQGSPKVLRWLA